MTDTSPNLLQQLGRTSRAMYGAFENTVGHALPRWRILIALQELPAATQKQLAQRLQMDPGALTRQLKTLQAEALVERSTDPADNRQTLVALTDAGQRLLAAAAPQRQAFFRQALDGIPAEQLSCALQVLQLMEQRFRAALENHKPEAPAAD